MTQTNTDDYRYCRAYGQLVGLFEILQSAARVEAATALRAKAFELCAKAQDIKREMDEANQRILNPNVEDKP